VSSFVQTPVDFGAANRRGFPRFGLLPGVVILWAIWAIVNLLSRGADAASGHLLDTDDYMRLAQWRDLLAGQDWLDLRQHRFAGPDGGDMHFSRISDMLMTIFYFAMEPALGPIIAERLTLIAYPMTLFLGFISATAIAARRIGGARAGWTAAIFSVLSLSVTMQFAPGRIDHHGLALMFSVAAFAATLFSFDDARCGALAGIAAALAAAVSLEVAPVLIAIPVAIAIPFVFRGETKSLRAFGGAQFLTAAALLFLLKGASALSSAHCDNFEAPAGAAFAAIGAIAFALSFSELKSAGARIGLGAGLAGIAGAGLYLIFPQCAGGPFEGMDPVVRDVWLTAVNEMQSPASLAKNQPELLVSFYIIPVLGLVAGVMAMKRARGDERLVLAAMLAPVAASAIMIAPAVRGVFIASTFAVFPLSLTIARFSEYIRLRPVENVAQFLAACLLLTPMIYTGAGGMIKNARAAGMGEDEGHSADCNAPAALAALDREAPALLFTELDIGPMILAHTHHSVTAAPYHRNVASIRRAIDFFMGDDSAAIAAFRDSGAKYLVLCPKSAEAKRYATLAPASVGARLFRGETPPWLEKKALDAASPLEIYVVIGE